jgi:hypothetical protein
LASLLQCSPGAQNAIPGGFHYEKVSAAFLFGRSGHSFDYSHCPVNVCATVRSRPGSGNAAAAGRCSATATERGPDAHSGDTTTQEAKTFTGSIAKENGELVLKDSVTKVSYKLDDPAKAKQYVGKHVKVTGKLDMNSNTIQIEGIKPLS